MGNDQNQQTTNLDNAQSVDNEPEYYRWLDAIKSWEWWKRQGMKAWQFSRDEMPVLIGFALLLIAVAFIFRILFNPVQLGVVSDADEVVVQSSERLVQIVQWTITTILLVVGGLLGLNWYRDDRSFRNDQEKLGAALNKLDSFQQQVESRPTDSISQMQTDLQTLREYSVMIAFEATIQRMYGAAQTEDMFLALIDGHSKLTKLEGPDLIKSSGEWRTQTLVREGLDLLRRTSGDISIEDPFGDVEEASSLFFLEARQTFPLYVRRLYQLEGRIKYLLDGESRG